MSNTFTPSLQKSFRGHRNAVTSSAFCPSAARTYQQLVSGSRDGNLLLWSTKPTVRALRLVGHRGPVTDVCYNTMGNLIVSSSVDGTIRLWIPTVRGGSSVIKAHSGAVRAVSFSHSDGGQQIISCSDDKSSKIWDVSTQKFVRSYTGHTNWVRCCAINNTSTLCATGGDDKIVQLWDPRSGAVSGAHCMYEHTNSVTAVQFHPDGLCVASASADRTINVWDLRMLTSGKGIPTLLQHYDTAHDDVISSISFDNISGAWLVSSSLDGTVKLWDLKQGYHYCTIEGAHNDGPVLGARFSPYLSHANPVSNSPQITTAGQDGIVMVWNSNLPSYAAGEAEGSNTKINPPTGTTSPMSPSITTPLSSNSPRLNSIPLKKSKTHPLSHGKENEIGNMAPTIKNVGNVTLHPPSKTRTPEMKTEEILSDEVRKLKNENIVQKGEITELRQLVKQLLDREGLV
eukprot:Tbor_TRINITY_DN4607_c0_g1::TRINITY_DN4607_c0_g1_i1::g.14918::m.14918/K16482/POC1; centriolar protein POC1